MRPCGPAGKRGFFVAPAPGRAGVCCFRKKQERAPLGPKAEAARPYGARLRTRLLNHARFPNGRAHGFAAPLRIALGLAQVPTRHTLSSAPTLEKGNDRGGWNIRLGGILLCNPKQLPPAPPPYGGGAGEGGEIGMSEGTDFAVVVRFYLDEKEISGTCFMKWDQ